MFFCTYLNKFERKVDVCSLHHDGKQGGGGGGGGNPCWTGTDVVTEGALSFHQSQVIIDYIRNQSQVTHVLSIASTLEFMV